MERTNFRGASTLIRSGTTIASSLPTRSHLTPRCSITPISARTSAMSGTLERRCHPGQIRVLIICCSTAFLAPHHPHRPSQGNPAFQDYLVHFNPDCTNRTSRRRNTGCARPGVTGHSADLR